MPENRKPFVLGEAGALLEFMAMETMPAAVIGLVGAASDRNLKNTMIHMYLIKAYMSQTLDVIETAIGNYNDEAEAIEFAEDLTNTLVENFPKLFQPPHVHDETCAMNDPSTHEFIIDKMADAFGTDSIEIDPETKMIRIDLSRAQEPPEDLEPEMFND